MTVRRGVVALHGEIDMNNAEQCGSLCAAALDDCPGERLVVDMSDVTFVDSSGMQALLELRRIAQLRGISVAVYGRRRHIARTFAILGLDDVLPEVDTLD